MKNIHVIPTDKPSRLFIGRYRKELFLCDKPTSNIFIAGQNQNIYITSNEEIKEGDWFYVKTPNIYGGNVAAKCLGFGENCWSEHILTDVADEKGYHPSHCVKIILTTDQDLIKDGVQAIDDEFLEWFVKNPSCEDVEVELFPKFSNKLYGIVIPKEEPKQETLNHIVYNIGDSIRIINPTENQPKLFITHKVDNNFGVVYYYQLDGKEESIGFSYIKKEEPKELTDLEIAAQKYSEPYRCPATNENEYCKHDIISAFNNGAKWQQEQDKKCYHPLPYRLAKSDINFECTLCGKFI